MLLELLICHGVGLLILGWVKSLRKSQPELALPCSPHYIILCRNRGKLSWSSKGLCVVGPPGRWIAGRACIRTLGDRPVANIKPILSLCWKKLVLLHLRLICAFDVSARFTSVLAASSVGMGSDLGSCLCCLLRFRNLFSSNSGLMCSQERSWENFVNIIIVEGISKCPFNCYGLH